MVKTFFVFITHLFLFCGKANCQSYLNGDFRKANYTTNGYKYCVYDFSVDGNGIKAKFFSKDAYSRYLSWKMNRQILLVTVSAFSNSWNFDAIPVGLCLDDGYVVNRVLSENMDGMVVVYNSGEIIVADLGKQVSIKTDSGTVALSVKYSYLDRYKFLKWGQDNKLTLFQTQLVYSAERELNFTNLRYGQKRERRFLAICKKGNISHHVIVDAPDQLELNLSAYYAKATLEYGGFEVSSILNLETGGRNILYVYNGAYLKDIAPNRRSEEAKIEKSTNLLVYYKE